MPVSDACVLCYVVDWTTSAVTCTVWFSCVGVQRLRTTCEWFPVPPHVRPPGGALLFRTGLLPLCLTREQSGVRLADFSALGLVVGPFQMTPDIP